MPAEDIRSVQEHRREVIARPLVERYLAVVLCAGRAVVVEPKVGGVAAEVMAELVVDDGRTVGRRMEVAGAAVPQEAPPRPEVNLAGWRWWLGFTEVPILLGWQAVVSTAPARLLLRVDTDLDPEVGQSAPEELGQVIHAAVQVVGDIHDAEGTGLPVGRRRG